MPKITEIPSTVNTREYLDPAQTEELENAALCLRDALLIRLLRKLGCRVSEVLGIHKSHVSFRDQSVSILHEKIRVKRSCLECGTRISKSFKLCPGCGTPVGDRIKKTEKEEKEFRSLPLDNETLDMIKEYLDRGGGYKVDGDIKIFNVSRQQVWKIVKDCAERAGLPRIINTRKQRIHNVSPHKLRDAFATNAANKDSSMEGLKHLQEHLGHRKIDTTMNYVRTTGDQHKTWLEKINKKEESDE